MTSAAADVISVPSVNNVKWLFAYHFDGLVQERRNSIANAMELRLSCTNTSGNEPILVFVSVASLQRND